MIKLGITTTMESMEILMNKCLHIGDTPTTWQNAQVILLHKKGDKLNLINFCPISLLPHPYKLLNKILPNRLTRKLDEYQSSDQAGFRKAHGTVEHLQEGKVGASTTKSAPSAKLSPKCPAGMIFLWFQGRGKIAALQLVPAVGYN